MKQINKKALLWALFIIIGTTIPMFLVEISCSSKEQRGIEKIKKDIIEKDTLFDYVINKIKVFESFRSEKYNCISNQDLIGYGHAIKKGENLTKITESQGDSILRLDFKTAVNFVKKHSKLKRKMEIYAISHFVFNLGGGKYLRSQLKKKIDNRESIKEELLKWNKIVYKGSITTSKHLLKRREFEINLFYGNLN